MDQQQLLDLALDSVPIGTYRWNQITGELFWNKHHFTLLGLDPNITEPTYELFRQRVHPEDIDVLEAEIIRAREAHSRHDYQFRVVWPDGRILFLRGSGLFSYDTNEQAEWMTGVLIDVTEAWAAQNRLERKERELATLIENSPDIYARFDLELRHMYVSPKIEEFTGRHHTHFVGKTSADLGMPHHLCLLWESAMKRAIAAKSATTVQFQFPTPGGDVHYFESRMVPELTAAGEVESLLCITSNVTEREKMLKTLRATEQRLVKADKSKDEFLATLAHEFKTPLAAITAGIEILQLTQLDQKSRSALELMTRQSNHLDALVEELWDVSSIVQQKTTFCWEPVNLALIINDAVALCMAELDRAGHRLNLELPTDPVMIYGDKRRLLQIFVNLISNSIKYTPAGGKLRLAVKNGPQLATVEVQDNGIGIPEEHQSQLFDIFFRVHLEDETSIRGLGIGLAVVKRLVEMHHGTVDILSGGNAVGTSVTVNFPHLNATLRSGTDHRE